MPGKVKLSGVVGYKVPLYEHHWSSGRGSGLLQTQGMAANGAWGCLGWRGSLCIGQQHALEVPDPVTSAEGTKWRNAPLKMSHDVVWPWQYRTNVECFAGFHDLHAVDVWYNYNPHIISSIKCYQTHGQVIWIVLTPSVYTHTDTELHIALLDPL